MGTLWQDVRHGAGMLARSPGYAIVVLLTLALGIGATTAIFSMVHGVLLRPLAFPQSQQLVFVGESISALADDLPVLPVCARHFLEWRQQCSSFESLALVGRSDMTITGTGEPERLEALQVSASLFETLRVPPAMGRLFVAEDEGEARRVAAISDGLWRRKFGANPSILGDAITLDQEAYTVIGVLPGAFRFPNVNPWAAAVIETSAQPAVFVPKVFTARERNGLMEDFRFTVIGRLKEGVTRSKAAAELNMLGARIVAMAGLKDFELRAIVEPLKEVLVHDSRRGLLVVLGAMGTLLLIACLNLGILSLARAERREGESAIRAALGATRAQLLRQGLVEALLLTILGSVTGVALAVRGLDVLIRVAPADLPRSSEVRIDTGVLVFALGLTGVTALLLGALPAWRVAGVRAEHLLQGGRRSATTMAAGLRLRNVLVAAEVGLGVTLLITAGLLLHSFERVVHADVGFQAPTVLTACVAPSPAKYKNRLVDGFYERLLERLASTVGVDSAAVANALPLQGEMWVDSVGVPADPRPEVERPRANMRFVSPGYFQALGIPLLEGRTFDSTDRAARRVVMISERLARSLWSQQDTVVGRRVMIDNRVWEVIGVVNDVRAEVDREAVPMLYRPYWALELDTATVVVRTRGDPLAMADAVRAAIHSMDADVPVTAMRTMREVLWESVSQRRFQMLLTATFASCALLLAGLGIYTVVSYSVTRRTREVGIRAALGARSEDLCAMVMWQGMIPVVLGLLCGVAGALVCGRVLRSLLYDVKTHDPLVITVVVLAVLATAALAGYIPARRAAKVDPMVALRYE